MPIQETTQRNVHRFKRASKLDAKSDFVAVEEPLEIRVETKPICVTMRSPGNDKELAAGFLFTEGIIKSAGDIHEIKRNPKSRNENILDVFLDPKVDFNLKHLKRHFFASSSCGICGKASIESVHKQFKPMRSRAHVTQPVISQLSQKLITAQKAFQQTGGLHASGLFNLEGQLIDSKEDIGRHNTVDKVIGKALFDKRLPLTKHILMVSGRASFEIIQKALAARIPIVVSVSAPSSLAIDFAIKSKMTLIGFVRGKQMNVYAGIDKLVRINT